MAPPMQSVIEEMSRGRSYWRNIGKEEDIMKQVSSVDIPQEVFSALSKVL